MKFINLFINQVKSCFGFEDEIESAKLGLCPSNDRELSLLENEMRIVSDPVYLYETGESKSVSETRTEVVSEEGSINYDSDIEDEDYDASDDDILEFNNISPYYKMDSILTVLEHNTLPDIIEYVEENHRGITLSSKSTIASITQALLKDTYENSSERQIVATMSRVKDIINNQTESLNQKAKRFSELRQILKKRFGEDSKIVKKHQRLGMTLEQHKAKEKVAKENRKERLEDRVQITDKEAIEILHRHSASDDVFDNLIALQLATGSRFIEATRLSAFKPSKREGWIKIVGIAKKPNDEVVTMERPILGLDLDELLEIVKRVRKELKQKYPKFESLDNDDLTKLLVNRVNTRIKKLGIEGVNSSHMLRKLYGNLTYKLLSQDERRKMDSHQWLQNILGHTSINTSASYANVKINKGGNKIVNAEEIERKFDEVDRKDEKQDRDIESLGQKIESIKPVEQKKIKQAGGATPKAGSAVERAKQVMDELHKKGINITEKLLKTEYHIGSKTITALKDYKKSLNESLNK